MKLIGWHDGSSITLLNRAAYWRENQPIASTNFSAVPAVFQCSARHGQDLSDCGYFV